MDSKVGPDPGVVSDILSFYSSELGSHAGMIVGLGVGLLALVQVEDKVSAYAFAGLAWVLSVGVVYSMMRIVYYGALSSALTQCAGSEYDSWLNSPDKKERLALAEHGRVTAFLGNWVPEHMLLRGKLWRRYYQRVGKSYDIPIEVSFVLSLLLLGVFVVVLFVAKV